MFVLQWTCCLFLCADASQCAPFVGELWVEHCLSLCVQMPATALLPLMVIAEILDFCVQMPARVALSGRQANMCLDSALGSASLHAPGTTFSNGALMLL